MAVRIRRNPESAISPDISFAEWARDEGEPVATARTSRVRRRSLGGHDLHVKVQVYSATGALRGMLRHTLLRPSRAAREYAMLLAFSRRGAAPRPVAVGERRLLGLLRESFLATESALGARGPAGADPALGAFLGALHAEGFVHGRLFARNVLALPDGAYLLVDLDRARAGRGRRAPDRQRAKDLAFLDASLPAGPRGPRLRALAAYRRATGESRGGLRSLLAAVERRRPEAEARLLSRGGRTSPSSSGARRG